MVAASNSYAMLSVYVGDDESNLNSEPCKS